MAPKSAEKASDLSLAPSTQIDPHEHPEQKVSAAQETSKDVEAHQGPPETVYPPTSVIIPIMAVIYLGLFVVALDRTILATAIPIITDDFNSLGDVGWYGSAYMLTGCTTQLLVGRLYTFYSQKVVYLSSLFLFELGSAICGAAPNSIVFIVGRAIAGLGSGGVFTGAIILMIPLVPLRKRPIFQGLGGALFGIASVVGPLLGGAFTQHVTWRWCFYINLPIGAITAVVVLFVLKQTAPPKNAAMSLKHKILQLDPLGNLCFVPGMICLLLALQWGGSTYAWGNARIIVLLTLGILLLIGFIVIQGINHNDTATVAPRIFNQRTILAAFWYTFCNSSAMMAIVYYMPIWFQAIKGVNAVNSGLMLLPLVLSLVVASLMTGALVTRFGYYTPFIISSSFIASIGAGLLTTFKTDSGRDYWIGYQFIFGFGLGLGMQQANIAVQCVLPKADVPVGTTLMFFAQQLGGAVFVSVCQNVFANELVKGVTKLVAGVSPQAVIGTGATHLRTVFGEDVLPGVLAAYNTALVKAFTVALAMCCFSIFGSAAIEWMSVKKHKEQEEGAPAVAPPQKVEVEKEGRPSTTAPSKNEADDQEENKE
ncbi:putative mfs multidrug protein [Neofusicoccum parvum UCRNP2]|uniref:Putative mfs multidrug protein n=1 Tax=Botryosphaeria parva (strain UCR-NP2) TaxID=1287680 RepID=R1GCZ3_BOTPV|nr:putative mfs multidrug protein [Neofusicoccum parvum UCRNP2]